MSNDIEKYLAQPRSSSQPGERSWEVESGGHEPVPLARADQLSTQAIAEFVDWADRNVAFLERGRQFGFKLAVSSSVKDAVALALDKTIANRINASLGDLER